MGRFKPYAVCSCGGGRASRLPALLWVCQRPFTSQPTPHLKSQHSRRYPRFYRGRDDRGVGELSGPSSRWHGRSSRCSPHTCCGERTVRSSAAGMQRMRCVPGTRRGPCISPRSRGGLLLACRGRGASHGGGRVRHRRCGNVVPRGMVAGNSDAEPCCPDGNGGDGGSCCARRSSGSYRWRGRRACVGVGPTCAPQRSGPVQSWSFCCRQGAIVAGYVPGFPS